jgi:hypothetical protein
MDEDKSYTHPSYGLVSFSHRQGNPKLFHSALEHHYNYVTLSIKTGTLIRTDTGDRLYGPMHGNLIEVDLSASQFSELLTTMNIGVGVACTVRSFNNKSVPPPPDIDSQTENLRTEFKDRAREFTQKVMGESEEIRELLKNKSALNKADREKITSLLTRVAQELAQNMPFFVEMYQEATEKVVDSAKAEIEGFMVGAIRQAGLAALAAGKVDITPPQLPTKTEE